jgi:hypothetical protein
LIRITYKDKLKWNLGTDQAFQDLKTAFITAPILIHSDFSRPFFLEIDASNCALVGVLSQKGDDEPLHLVAFNSQKFTATEINYEIHDKEFLAIVNSF